MAFDEQHTDPFRPTHTSSGYGATRPQHHDDFSSSYGVGAAAQQQQTRFSPPLRRPNYTANDMAATTEMRERQQQQNMMSGTNPFYGMSQQAGQDPNLYSSGGAGLNSSSAGYTSAATAAGPSNLRSAMKQNVAFQDVSGTGTESAHLTRPREEETIRGEANAGAMPDKRDGLGTL